MIENELKSSGFRGSMYPKGAEGYEEFRPVPNGACNHRFPLVILRPTDSLDVAIGVKFAKSLNLTISVRSGGHSYICSSIKHNSLHFDMRSLNKVELLPEYYNDVRILCPKTLRLMELNLSASFIRALKQDY